ncbi:MAG: hypothetical protein H6713_15580 [Myxococcales bacterium]|nr:hypothetical protein [Myxococcales bacterium]
MTTIRLFPRFKIARASRAYEFVLYFGDADNNALQVLAETATIQVEAASLDECNVQLTPYVGPSDLEGLVLSVRSGPTASTLRPVTLNSSKRYDLGTYAATTRPTIVVQLIGRWGTTSSVSTSKTYTLSLDFVAEASTGGGDPSAPSPTGGDDDPPPKPIVFGPPAEPPPPPHPDWWPPDYRASVKTRLDPAALRTPAGLSRLGRLSPEMTKLDGLTKLDGVDMARVVKNNKFNK